MVVISEGFLQHHEARALNITQNNNILIKSFKRYVDDSHVRVKLIEDGEKFLEILNQQSTHLNYTMENEHE